MLVPDGVLGNGDDASAGDASTPHLLSLFSSPFQSNASPAPGLNRPRFSARRFSPVEFRCRNVDAEGRQRVHHPIYQSNLGFAPENLEEGADAKVLLKQRKAQSFHVFRSERRRVEMDGVQIVSADPVFGDVGRVEVDDPFFRGCSDDYKGLGRRKKV